MIRILASWLVVWLAILTLTGLATGQRARAEEDSAGQLLQRLGKQELRVTPVGVSNDGAAIEAVVASGALPGGTSGTQILLVGQSARSAEAIGQAMAWFYGDDEAAEYRQRFRLAAVPNARPGPSPRQPAAFPPAGKAYGDPNTGESIYLWRWLGMQAPDLVVDVQVADAESGWFVPPGKLSGLANLADKLGPAASGQPGELATALGEHEACDVGRIPAVRVTLAQAQSPKFLRELLDAVQTSGFQGPSAARTVLQQRLARTPLEVARQLSVHYGHDLNQVVYIPALALVGRLRLGELTGDESHLRDVLRIVQPYVEGQRPTNPNSGSGLSGHLIFAELADRSQGEQRERFIELASAAADLAFDREGQVRPIMPYHSEMSDALFMGGPILAHVGRLTGDTRYFDACRQHLQSMRKLVLRDDGLYRHSPLDEAAWGRGNGFPALGLALCLTHWPEDRADRGELLTMFQTHLAILARYQDEEGCWHQVVDRAETYRELSSTCMITFAMLRGVNRGWLERKTYAPHIERGWQAIQRRVASDGRLVDVCTGTGKQKSLEEYFQREAILGRDPRGGAMALIVATEIASSKQK